MMKTPVVMETYLLRIAINFRWLPHVETALIKWQSRDFLTYFSYLHFLMFIFITDWDIDNIIKSNFITKDGFRFLNRINWKLFQPSMLKNGPCIVQD